MIHFFVPGIARTKGSARAFVRGGRAVIANDNPREKDWAQRIALAAREAMKGRDPICVPVMLKLAFQIQRPRRHYKASYECSGREALCSGSGSVDQRVG